MSGDSTQIDLSVRYAIERELGRGATSTVYLARDTIGGRLVAIKVLRPELAASIGGERFLREIRLTARLHHPNIVPLLDSGERDGTLAFVLPYLDGGTLRGKLDREKQLPIRESVAITRTLALALDHAHTQGLVHRDVKPENILFTAEQPCLADFGIARALEGGTGETTSTGIIRGTPAYMSPEQAAGERHIDGRSDIYSLACVLYEMITGMAPFVGPTPQSVMAQRVTVTPRPASVYRPLIPAELDAVLERALAAAPADRYQTAKEFADALEATTNESLGVSSATGASRRTSARWWRGAAAVLVVAAGAFAVARLLPSRDNAIADVRPDTTLILILPVESDSEVPASEQTEMLAEAFSRWRGIGVVDQFQVSDAVRRRGVAIASNDEARSMALQFHAGRFVRARVSARDQRTHIRIALYDVRSAAAPLSVAQSPADIAPGQAGVAYARLVDSLLLRGSSTAGVRQPQSTGTRSLPALQAFLRGQAALETWDLPLADTLFGASVGYDPSFSRARFWEAQVRDWQRMPPASYLSLIDAVLPDTARLSDRERRLALALAALGAGDFSAACARYDELRRQNDADFAAWHGLGRCNSLDNTIIRDPASPSGWRFRRSYHQAVMAFTRSFELLPSVSRWFETGGFEPLQRLLFVYPTQRRGGKAADGDSLRFAYPAWRGDSLLFVPYTLRQLGELSSGSFRDERARALVQQRNLLLKIATQWAGALPRNSGTKEALALALDLLGDRAAIDTIRAARALTSDPRRRVRLAATEVVLGFKYGVPQDLAIIRRARGLADSVLGWAPHLSAEDAAYLVPVAAIAGDCARLDSVTRAAAVDATNPVFIPRYLMAESHALTVSAATGCNSAGIGHSMDRLSEGIASVSKVPAERDLLRDLLLSQALPLLYPREAARAVSVGANGDYMLDAERAAQRRDTAAVRAIFARVRTARREALGEAGMGTPDAVLSEATLMLAVGDSTEAAAWLDGLLKHVSRYPTADFRANEATAGSLVRAMIVRTRLAQAMHDVTTAKQWAMAVNACWSNASPELLQAVADRDGSRR